MRMRKSVLALLLAAAAGGTASAQMKFRGGIVEYVQPDGGSVSLRHVARDGMCVTSTADGYAVEKKGGAYVYVGGVKGRELVLTDVVAHAAGERGDEERLALDRCLTADSLWSLLESGPDSQNFISSRGTLLNARIKKSLKSTGAPVIPVILAQFVDRKFSLAEGDENIKAVYDQFFNSTDTFGASNGYGSAGSVRRYFVDQSEGVFEPQFDIIGPLTLDDSCAYYGHNQGSTIDVNIHEFYDHAVNKASVLGTDWNKYDSDGDGAVDMVIFIYAGVGENSQVNGVRDYDAIWPKENSSGGTINGKSISVYVCCNELYKSKLDGIGTVCHEISHALGLPDFYDTNNGTAYGMDYWDLMDSGSYCRDSYCPSGYSTYEMNYLGWRSLETLEYGVPRKVTLTPVSGGGTGYKVVNTENSNEFYVLENRQNKLWDSYVGNSTRTSKHNGMLVTHVDYRSSNWSSNTVNTNAAHQRITIIPADGELYPYGEVNTTSDYTAYLMSAAGDPYPGAKDVHELADTAAVVFSSSGFMNQPIRDIEQDENGVVTLKYFVTKKLSTPEFPDAQEAGKVTWSAVDGATSYEIRHSRSQEMGDAAKITVVKNGISLDNLFAEYERSEDAVRYLEVRALADTLLNSDFSPVISVRYSAADGIAPVIVEEMRVRVDGNCVTVSEDADIYTVQGTYAGHADAGESFALGGSGIYVLRSHGKSCKVVVAE